jgi:hypothetical protein
VQAIRRFPEEQRGEHCLKQDTQKRKTRSQTGSHEQHITRDFSWITSMTSNSSRVARCWTSNARMPLEMKSCHGGPAHFV